MRITATEAARSFSDVLSRVAAGERIEVTRGGTSIAVLSAPSRALISAERFREVLETAPPSDDAFGADLADIRNSVGEPPESRWPS